VYASINGESIAVTQLAAGSYTLAPPVDLGLGAHVVILGLIDAAGNIRQVTRTINVVDTTDPALTVATPSTVWHRTCAPMSYRADDAMSGVWDMRIVRSGGAVADSYTRTTPRTVSIPGDLSIDRSPCLVPPSSGTFSYTATSADYAGNDVTGASFDVRFDVTDPTASINVTNGAEYNVPRPELVLTADDAHSGIAAIAATLDGATITPSSVNGSTRSYQPATALSLGAHALAVTVTDNAGNVATLTRSFTIVDETAPAVTLEMPPSGAGSSTVTVGVDDGASGVDPDSWRVQVNNVDLIVQGTTTGLTFALPALVNGTHKVAIAVDDLDGNRTTRLVDYVVDNKNGVYPVTWEQTSAITVYDAPPIARRGSTYPVKAIVAFGGRAVPGTADVLKNGVVVASAPIAPTGAVSINIPIDDGTPLRIVAPRQPELSAQLIWSYDSAETCNGLPVAESGCEDDKTAPTVTVVAVQQPRGKLLRSKSATVRVTSSELGLVTLALPGAKATTKAVARQKATTVTLRLTPPILKALKKAQDAKKKTFVISLRLTATDARSNAIAPRTIRLSFKL
jgi:hypothetical protein